MHNSGEFKSIKQLKAIFGTDIATNLEHQVEESN